MWDQERSEKRIREHLEKLPAIEIKKLEKLADLESLLSECVCREITGAHVYIDLDHFSRLVAGDEEFATTGARIAQYTGGEWVSA